MPRRCWTCGSEHDPDAACRMSGVNRSRIAAGGAPDLFDEPEDAPRLGPVFTSRFDSECDACDGAIYSGTSIRAWPGYGYIHANNECERIARD